MTKRLSIVGAMVLAVAVGACGGRGGGGDGAQKISVELKEYALVPSASSVTSGQVAFEARNTGSIPHELVVLKTDLAPDALPVQEGKVDEEAPGVEAIGEIEEFEGGKTMSASFDLEPGTYVLICNVAGHYGLGMRASLQAK